MAKLSSYSVGCCIYIAINPDPLLIGVVVVVERKFCLILACHLRVTVFHREGQRLVKFSHTATCPPDIETEGNPYYTSRLGKATLFESFSPATNFTWLVYGTAWDLQCKIELRECYFLWHRGFKAHAWYHGCLVCDPDGQQNR